MRIALITPGFSANAADWAIPALQTLALALAQEHDLTIFSLRYPAGGYYQWGNFSHQAIGGAQRHGFASIGIWRKTIKAIVQRHRQAPFDILHAFWADEPGLVAVQAAARIKRPAIVSLGGGELTHLPDIDYGTQGSFVRRQIIRRSLKKAKAVTAGSSYQLNLAHVYGLKNNKTHHVPLGVNTDQFQPAKTPSWKRPTIIQAASLTPVKNQTLLLETVALIKKELPNFHLLLAGDGPLRPTLKTIAQSHQIENNITWAGAVPYESMAEIYHQGHLYLQSSRHESQGMSVLEAMSCGLPVIGTPVGVTAELANLPATNDAAELAAQAIKILSDPIQYETLRQQARQAVINSYSLDYTIQQFLSLYQGLSKGS